MDLAETDTKTSIRNKLLAMPPMTEFRYMPLLRLKPRIEWNENYWRRVTHSQDVFRMKFESALRVGDFVIFDDKPAQITLIQSYPLRGVYYNIFTLDDTTQIEFALVGPFIFPRHVSGLMNKTFKLIGSEAHYAALVRQMSRQRGLPNELAEHIAVAMGIPRTTTRSTRLGRRRTRR
jgi:hypothetical protein